ncbi:MAG: MerR family transcriptional regulator [Nitrososphaera sp.]|nr:MerR family transcriptional regulator [Nitrososphaera sp.]
MTSSKASLYGSVVAAKEAGLSLRQLYHWVDVLQVVQPQLHQCGMRSFRRFTSADLKVLKMIKSLVEEGYTLRAAARMVKSRPTSPDTATNRGEGV